MSRIALKLEQPENENKHNVCSIMRHTLRQSFHTDGNFVFQAFVLYACQRNENSKYGIEYVMNTI